MPQIVLVEPQIPPNTGNIARTCAATKTPLHLVGPLGFKIDDRHLKRAGLDYWPYVDLTYYDSWAEFAALRSSRSGRCLGFTTRGQHQHTQFEFAATDWLLFGCETEGLSEAVLASCDATIRIPIAEPSVRSLNLSVSATIGLFEALRQLGAV
ncbi:MAG: tRNA (cytidine(34)-2'-O)-methyltransferase [Geitlerinemataceae cyanobacterium]